MFEEDAKDLLLPHMPWMDGHRSRLRARSETGGWDALRDFEMIEVLLGYVVPRQDLSRTARALIDEFGGVMGALTAPVEAMLQVEGVTPSIAAWLRQTGEMVGLYLAAEQKGGIPMRSPADVRRFLMPRLDRARPGDCWVLYVNFERDLICCQPLRGGAGWWKPENVRRMVEDCVSLQARYAVIALFRGQLSPRLSASEMERLGSIRDTLNALEVRLMDCALVAEGKVGFAGLNRNL